MVNEGWEPVASMSRLVDLPVDTPVWDRFFGVYPLVLVATLEEDGSHDIAPKHLAMPMSWDNWFGFVCTPRHRTYANARRDGVFTVSYPRPRQVVLTSLAAAPRNEEGDKPALQALPVRPAARVRGVLVEGCSLWLECELERVVDGFGVNSLLAGRVVAAQAEEAILRETDRDDGELLLREPLLAYLAPGRFAEVGASQGFPFHAGFCR